MIQPPSPPQKANEYLTELAQYYRELIEYHQLAAIAAAQQLGHVEALLGNDAELPTQQVRSWLVDESNQPPTITPDSTDNNPKQDEVSLFEELDDEYEEEDNLEVVGDGGSKEEGYHKEDDNQDGDKKMSVPSLEQLHELFKAERGNMLHIDYIVHHYYGNREKHQRVKMLPPLLEQLKLGSLKHLWCQVPDDPDCWTFRLLDFPEFAPPNQDNTLFPDLTSEVLPTKKVAELLSINKEKIYELRDSYPSEFVQGVDYFQNNRGHYFWSQSAIEKLKTKRKELPQKPSDVLMLLEYRGLSRVDAIKKLFASQSPKNWTITEVVNGLYGDIEKVS